MTDTPTTAVPEDIQTAYNQLALKMGDLAFRERDLAAELSRVQETIKTLQSSRMALQKRLSETAAPAPEASTDAVATPNP